jgi:hypothetical protein
LRQHPFTFITLLVAICATRLSAEPAIELQKDDVVAFIGGESVVEAAENGFLESILAAKFAGQHIRFRNLGWEGDTVFVQPRDLNFPGTLEQLKRIKATVVFAEFGRAEVLADVKVDAFISAYEKLCDELTKQTPRIVLVTPAPFEKPARAIIPDLSARNEELARFAQATRELAKRRGYSCVSLDVKQPMSPEMESLRQAVIAKNRLWFDYWRPMNWAFLGGDRTFTASSRDPNDANIRVFPRELEKFVPLIEKADAKIDELAKAAATKDK